MKRLLTSVALLALAACSSDGPPDVSNYPKVPYKAKVGNAYQVSGKWYAPHYNPEYDQEGVASWYGPGFHGKKTANGESYNQYAFTAAHTTLPMPSIVRVTNLENGRALNVRINDRGPFHSNRIIDLSKAAAEKLDVVKNGVARVRVQYLPEETQAYVSSHGKRGDELQFASNSGGYNGAVPKPQPRPVEVAIVQDIDTLPLESAGQQEAAPTTEIAIKDLPDVTVQQLDEQRVDWLIQVASYADNINAEKMIGKLKAVGNPFMQVVSIKGQPFYRVLLKPLSNASDHFEALAQLKNFGIYDAKVISR